MDNRRKQLAGNTAILLIGKLCTQFINFFMLPLYTAILAPEEYGIVDLFNTYVTLLLPLVNFKMDLGLFRFMLDVRQDKKKQSQLVSSVLIHNCRNAAIYIIVFFIVQNYIQSQYKIFLLLHVILNIFSSTLLQFARGLGHNIAYSFASFLCAFTTVILNVLFIAVFRIGAVGMFWSVVGGQVITIIYLTISQKMLKIFSFKLYDKKLVKEVTKYSLPLVPSNLSWWVISASDRTIISSFINVAANGIYSVASKFSSVINTIYGVFNMAWTETVSLHIDDEDGSTFLSDMINEMYNLFFSLCIVVLAIMPYAFSFIVNDKYKAAYELIPILVIAIFAQIVCGLFSVIFIAKKNTNENAKTAIFAAIINVVINIVFIKRIGLYAAALSTLVAYSAMAVYRYFSAQRYIKITLSIRNMLLSFVIAGIVIGNYYAGSKISQLLSFFITMFYIFVINKSTILGILTQLQKRTHRKER